MRDIFNEKGKTAPMNRPFWIPARQPESDSCASIDPLLSLYADGMASGAEARLVESHLPGCESCRESLVWMQATRRALAGRPVVTPPVYLRERIAQSLAASPLPVSARPARAFILRPAYAAAASLSLLGILVGYGLLHHSSASVRRTPSSQPMVAVVPQPGPSMSKVRVPGILPRKTFSRPAIIRKPAPRGGEMVATNRAGENSDMVSSDPTQPDVKHAPAKPLALKSGDKVQPSVKMPPRPVLRKKPLAAANHRNLVAILPKPEPIHDTAPKAMPPESGTSEKFAVNTASPPAPAVIAPSDVAPEPAETRVAVQPETREPRVKTASILSSVNSYAVALRLDRNVRLAGRTAIRASVHSMSLTTGTDSPEAKIMPIYTP